MPVQRAHKGAFCSHLCSSPAGGFASVPASFSLGSLSCKTWRQGWHEGDRLRQGRTAWEGDGAAFACSDNPWGPAGLAVLGVFEVRLSDLQSWGRNLGLGEVNKEVLPGVRSSHPWRSRSSGLWAPREIAGGGQR